MAKLSGSINVNGTTTEYDFPDEQCKANCIADFYRTLADLSVGCDHAARTKNCCNCCGNTLFVTGYTSVDGGQVDIAPIVVSGLSDSDLKAAQDAFTVCCNKHKQYQRKP